ncbi:MAG: ketoacyl-ACP synthase III [Bacteroidetes bacterium]|nr:ketoacyl-ACP synthase III [Bacteroidota bacterium]
MASFSISGVRIAGMAAAVPKNSESNWDCDLIPEKDRKMLIKTIGVETRRIVPAGMATSDLCFEATDKLLNELNWKREDISLLVFVSQSGDYYLPATAVILQDRLGLPKSCLAFDVGLGCSGFVYGLSIIAGLMNSSGIKKGLLMAGDVSSIICSKEDKSTYPLFGDAGTVTALESDKNAAPMNFNLNSDGSGFNAIIVPDGGSRNRITEDSLVLQKISDGITRRSLNLALNGIDVFNFSLTTVPSLIHTLFKDTHTTEKDYDYFIFHQANLLINETIRKKLGIAPEKVPHSIKKYGNTSSASIPLTIISELRNEISSKPLSIVCAGFGVGLSWGAVSVKTNKIITLPVLEI